MCVSCLCTEHRAPSLHCELTLRTGIATASLPHEASAWLTRCPCLDDSGYVRQRGLNVNGLLHIPGAGDFQMDRIDGLSELQPQQTSGGPQQSGSDGMPPTCSSAHLAS